MSKLDKNDVYFIVSLVIGLSSTSFFVIAVNEFGAALLDHPTGVVSAMCLSFALGLIVAYFIVDIQISRDVKREQREEARKRDEEARKEARLAEENAKKRTRRLKEYYYGLEASEKRLLYEIYVDGELYLKPRSIDHLHRSEVQYTFCYFTMMPDDTVKWFFRDGIREFFEQNEGLFDDVKDMDLST